MQLYLLTSNRKYFEASKAWYTWYSNHQNIVRAYPFHLETIDILFERWATIPTFQRTRGALRLLAEVVADLFKKEHSAPLIQPAHINLANSAIRREAISLVEEAEEQSNSKLEAEIAANMDLSRVPWGKQLLRVVVFNCPHQ